MLGTITSQFNSRFYPSVQDHSALHAASGINIKDFRNDLQLTEGNLGEEHIIQSTEVPRPVILNFTDGTEDFYIAAALFAIPRFAGSLAFIGHDFLLLFRKGDEKPVASMHGLCTSRENPKQKLPIGGWSRDHTLRAHHCVYDSDFSRQFHFPMDTFKLPAKVTETIYEDPDTLQLWIRTVVDVMPKLNRLDLDYPLLGIGFKRPVVNSNSTYWTLCQKMEIKPYDFPGYWQPGWGNEMARPDPQSVQSSIPVPVNAYA